MLIEVAEYCNTLDRGLVMDKHQTLFTGRVLSRDNIACKRLIVLLMTIVMRMTISVVIAIT